MNALTRLVTVILCCISGVNSHAATVIWQEAESFEHTGTWSNDSQHVDIMGSPYLLATGVGRPVEDAVTTVTVPKADLYTLWVRCRDWYPSHSPGRFQVSVGGQPSAVAFGKAASDVWQWVCGGRFPLKQGKFELRLCDATGWWGRCDAMVLAPQGFKPSNDLQTLASQRLRYTGVSPEIRDMGPYDLVVVGGGPAGIGAAVAAARQGIKVALIQDRPVLGGNASSEIMIPPQGASITGIAEELYPIMAWEHFADSGHALEMVESEPMISLFLNTRATGAEKTDVQTIAAVLALDVHSGQRLRFSAPLFADTTGHGWIGFYAGAEWRMGTEARSEFGESMAPVTANPYTMGNDLYRADFREMGKPDCFNTPAWAYHFDSPDDFVRSVPRTKKVVRPEAYDRASKGPGRPVNVTGPKRGGAFTWFVEFGGTLNMIDDAETIRDELFRLHMGLWGYVKNHDPKGISENRNLRMVWLNYVAGTRESRRLIGDTLMTQRDYEEDLKHPDLVAFTRWGIDDHQPHGFFTKGIDAMHVLQGKYVGIPYRSLYSKNIDNLFMAGRCLSASHMAMAGVRVMRPMAATGQAIGTAAALATRCDLTARGIYKQHITELQQTLLKDGCYIPGVRNHDLQDHALMAKTRSYAVIDGWNQAVKTVNEVVPWGEEPIELELQAPTTVACIHLSLEDRNNTVTFVVEALINGLWQGLVRSPGTSPQRRYVYNVRPVKTSRVRFRLIDSSGPVALAEVRIYSGPGRETTLPLPEPVGFPPIFSD
jgi:hypothetical protein